MDTFLNALHHSFNHAIMITAFVAMMMVMIEYLNVLSRGLWQKNLRSSRWKQYLLAAFLGATPGCLGAFAAVSLYAHCEISLGAVVAAMIATSGDESFVMLSMIPGQAPLIFLLLIGVALLAAVVTDLIFPSRGADETSCSHDLHLHEHDNAFSFDKQQLASQWRHCSPARGVLCLGLALFLFGVIAGQLGFDEWGWERITLVIVSIFALAIIATVPDHFLDEHLWHHVVMVHVPRIFLWTLAALLAMHLILEQLHLETWLHENQLIVLVLACLVGLIPESGPHLIFLTLYVEGSIPLSIFLASSVVQDGHGMLPMLAESRPDFFKIKTINFIFGMAMGLAGYFSGW